MSHSMKPYSETWKRTEIIGREGGRKDGRKEWMRREGGRKERRGRKEGRKGMLGLTLPSLQYCHWMVSLREPTQGGLGTVAATSILRKKEPAAKLPSMSRLSAHQNKE